LDFSSSFGSVWAGFSDTSAAPGRRCSHYSVWHWCFVLSTPLRKTGQWTGFMIGFAGLEQFGQAALLIAEIKRRQ
jgi:hypothetical protein